MTSTAARAPRASRLTRALTFTLAVAASATPARATWSILLIDTRTGEIAIGSATCLTGRDLRAITPVLVINRGAATAQASVSLTSITNRAIIWNGLQQVSSPTQILATLAGQDPNHQTRQYGIIDVSGGKVTFSGSSNSAWAGGVTGSVGTVHYAIQGNILTGLPVVTAAQQAVIGTPGDLAEKLMAAMEAARRMGGDGRCSCTTGSATSCGSPPANFTKSAHIGFMIVARQGDTDGSCTSATVGCASGSYWLNLNIANQTSTALDPVLQLRPLFDAWRAAHVGRPDHHLSTVAVDPTRLVPGGAASARVTVRLRDWRNQPLTTGGAAVTVALDPSSTTTATFGAVTDHGDGSYSFPVTAGATSGDLRLRITAHDGVRPVLLTPRTTIPVRADALWASTGRAPAAAGSTVDFHLDGGTANAGNLYALALSASGTSPGIPFPPIVIPLNHDALFDLSLQAANSTVFVNTVGLLDPSGRARARFVPPPGVLTPLVGRDLDFAFALVQPVTLASNPVRLVIDP